MQKKSATAGESAGRSREDGLGHRGTGQSGKTTPIVFAPLWGCTIAATKRAETPRRIPRPDPLSSFFCAPSAGQRLDPLYLFARLLIDGGVSEVDVPVQARVRVVLVVGCCVEGIAGWRYSMLVHRTYLLWAAPPGD